MHIDYGYTATPVWNENPVQTNAIVFNFTFVVLINMVISAVISGIIIDSFSEKRQEVAEKYDDTKNRCFICNIDRENFEREGIDFDTHIRRYHNMWHYVWIIMSLEEMDHDEFSGQFDYIWDHYQKRSIAFFPIKRAVQISSLGDKTETVERQVEKI